MKRWMLGLMMVSGTALADVPGGGCNMVGAPINPMGMAAICLGFGVAAFVMLRRR